MLMQRLEHGLPVAAERASVNLPLSRRDGGHCRRFHLASVTSAWRLGRRLGFACGGWLGLLAGRSRVHELLLGLGELERLALGVLAPSPPAAVIFSRADLLYQPALTVSFLRRARHRPGSSPGSLVSGTRPGLDQGGGIHRRAVVELVSSSPRFTMWKSVLEVIVARSRAWAGGGCSGVWPPSWPGFQCGLADAGLRALGAAAAGLAVAAGFAAALALWLLLARRGRR